MVAEQIVQKVAAAARGIGVLRPAIVLGQRRQHRAALAFALGAAEAAAAQPLEAGGDLVQIAAHLLDLVVDRTALRRLAREQREETGTVAAHPLGLRGDAIEFALLLGGGFLVAADLLFLGRIAAAAAAVDGRQLRFQPRAHRIERRAALQGRRRPGFICAEASTLSATAPSSAAQARNPAGEGGHSTFQPYPAIETTRRPKSAADAAPHTRFSGQRHVVSGAPVWRSWQPQALPGQNGVSAGR